MRTYTHPAVPVRCPLFRLRADWQLLAQEGGGVKGSGVGRVRGRLAAASRSGYSCGSDDSADVVGPEGQLDGMGDFRVCAASLGRFDDGRAESRGRFAVGGGGVLEFGLHLGVHPFRVSWACYHTLPVEHISCAGTDKLLSRQFSKDGVSEAAFGLHKRRRRTLPRAQ